jgi:hypothetical protein
MIATVVEGVEGLVGEVGDLEPHPAPDPVTATAGTAAMRRRPLMTAIMSEPCKYS